jgi:hypothetical protein
MFSAMKSCFVETAKKLLEYGPDINFYQWEVGRRLISIICHCDQVGDLL